LGKSALIIHRADSHRKETNMIGAIIGGTGAESFSEAKLEPRVVDTPFGQSRVALGRDEFEGLAFVPRHGLDHQVPPHKVNYRANLMALYQLGIDRVLATFAVGSVDEAIPPGELVLLDQFIDLTQGRQGTFFDGGDFGLAHTDVTYPYCPGLGRQVLEMAAPRGLRIRPGGTYAATNGPRLETAAEIRMAALVGAHVVGMTGVPEVQLARELSMHYAAVAISTNYAAGVKGPVAMDEDALATGGATLIPLFMDVLRSFVPGSCECRTSVFVIHPPTAWNWRDPEASSHNPDGAAKAMGSSMGHEG